ncbi:unnamed protein product [Linum trigynum]|uniref:Uncharacterized protein n=1 Tax=Linum trigynum TaxID=586398 RepID=A0AAV2C8H0_9ROSI
MGGEQKLTTMVIKVDLDCYKCRNKIKKVLCRIPQIGNQVYDEKANLVIITVLCCSPEKVMEKIACKGGESVKGIEIVKPPPPKPEEEPKKPDEPPRPKEISADMGKPKEQPKDRETAKAVMSSPALPMCYCHREFYEGRGVAPPPCYSVQGHPCYEGYGRPVYDSWGGGYRGGYYVSRGECFSDDNPSDCILM